MKKKFTVRPANRLFVTGLAVMFVLFAGVACYYSVAFQLREQQLECGDILNELFETYHDKVYSLSSVYEPVFHQNPDQRVMRDYFARIGVQTPKANDHIALAEILSIMVQQDNDIDWIALYNPNADRNYFLARGRYQISVLPNDFPYITDIKGTGMQRLGVKTWMDMNKTVYTSYCIKGGAIPLGTEGCIFIGYNLDSMSRVLRRNNADDAVTYLVLADHQLIFDSSGTRYGADYDSSWLNAEGGTLVDPDGRRWFVGRMINDGRPFVCIYLYPWWEGVTRAMAEMPLLVGLLVAFTAAALLLYVLTSRRIFRRVTQINAGLTEIGQNHLEHRLALSNSADEFDEISRSINTMAELLQTSVQTEYELRLKHMHLQLTQIQARFNPHFLYNTLEIIRTRLFESGDIESADYIEKLARIFRNLTDAKSIIKLRDEISFCSLYVALLQLRASGDVNVSYDVPPELLDCGIIANLIQPAIENYFVHAIKEDVECNELEITCQTLGDADLQITIADNGMGASAERIGQINAQLSRPDLNTPNYGLMSIAKRIKIFYGDRYGIHLEPNEDAGLRVIIRIPRMSVAEHETKLITST